MEPLFAVPKTINGITWE